jgi:hypothetical protein
MIDNVIIFLNNKTCFELSLLGINDRTTMIWMKEELDKKKLDANSSKHV